MANVGLTGFNRRMLITSAVWAVLSVVFLHIAVAKVMNLKAKHQPVNGLRYGEVGFWIVLLTCWVWNMWRSWTRHRAQGKVV